MPKSGENFVLCLPQHVKTLLQAYVALSDLSVALSVGQGAVC